VATRQQQPGLYDERLFQHLLAIERKRSERSGRPLLLVLITNHEAPESEHLNSQTALAIFRALQHILREVDFVGWYQEGQIVGAVLTTSAGLNRLSARDVQQGVCDRISVALRQRLPGRIGRTIGVRVGVPVTASP